MNTENFVWENEEKKIGCDESSGADAERCGKLKYQQSLQ